MTPLVVVAVFGSSALAGLLATGAVIPLAWRLGLIDHPNSRSSHQTVTPRGGGLGILVGLVVGTLVGRPGGGPAMLALGGGAAILAVIGSIDDRRGLPASLRLLCHLGVGAMLISVTGPFDRLPLPAPWDIPLGVMARPLSVLWVAGVVNVYNFLDGIDGFAGLQGLVTSLAIAMAAWDRDASIAALALAGGCLGFLGWNWSPARVFMGDLGSGAVGFLLAGLPFAATPIERHNAVFVVALSLCFFIGDATLTFVRRLARGERVWEAHREHCYQRIVRRVNSHSAVAAAICAASGVVTVLGVMWWRARTPSLALASIVVAAALVVLETWIAASQPRAAE